MSHGMKEPLYASNETPFGFIFLISGELFLAIITSPSPYA